ncbi:MAG: hypothetical protein ACREFK_09085, partial [Stellaceae bacterium]
RRPPRPRRLSGHPPNPMRPFHPRSGLSSYGNFILFDKNDVATITAPLPYQILNEIAQAKTVGIGVDSGGKGPPIFLGFIGMPFGEKGKSAFHYLVQICQ